MMFGVTCVSNHPQSPFSMHNHAFPPSLGQTGEEHTLSKILSVDTLSLGFYLLFASSKPLGGLCLASVR